MLRQGHLTPGQQRAFETIWPSMGVEFEGRPLDLPTLFGNDRPVFLEIGFGNGESLAEMAAANPENNYLGVEVHRPGIGHLLLKAEELSLKNLRLLRHDGTEVVREGIADTTLAAVYLFFPDPWHKKKHHKRRILQAPFIEQLARTIHPGGLFHAATDWEHYAKHMMAELSAAPTLFENHFGPGNYAPRPADRPLTKFERRGQRLGHDIWDLIFQRR